MSTISILASPKVRMPSRQLLSERFEFRGLEPPATTSVLQRMMLAEFKRRLEHGEFQLVYQPCPCGSERESILLSDVDRYGLPLRNVLCLTCGTVRIDPYLDTRSLENFYSELYQDLYGRALEPLPYFDRQRAYGKKIWAVMCGDRPSEKGAVLEIGCGAGGGLFEFQAAGHQVAGCDFSERLITYGIQREVSDLIVGGIAQIQQQLPGRSFHLVYLHHVYEHVSDPIGLLHEIRSVLASDSRVLIIVPDLSRIDQFVNPAGDALDFFHVAHKFNYSLSGLKAIAHRAGFSVSQIFPPQKMATAWSRSPELWVELRIAGRNPQVQFEDGAGRQLWDYLKRTEQKYRWGLCRAQVAATLRGLRPDRLISGWIRQLRKS